MASDDINSAELPPKFRKRHFTERVGLPVVQRWTMEKGALVGFLTGMGYTSGEIARRLADGTISSSIRAQWQHWELAIDEVGDSTHRKIFLDLKFHERAKLARQAKKRGLTPQEYLRRISVCAIRDDLYEAIVSDTV
ncbi:hypothetical protein [Mesorhizobium sp.]|uniref:hypothetical protein n=1 Tax=Mesorhizobium sp. TaxID=1871066 RepID=UPI000FE489E1|nr:hypothetical protein [Mesorhizobium sp.]RWM29782.1 MAG: hypothetical protein EOR75_31890 [Mesorhizobium sp.]TJV47680.1 MAG: hypothetical protein E5Y01_31745 [Mesorhizobium sp.]